MTRINLIPAHELSDQHLLAEIRELPRIFSHVKKHGVNKDKIPQKFCLGTGHMLFFTDKLKFLFRRYSLLYLEWCKRGFTLKYTSSSLYDDYFNMIRNSNDYKASIEDVNISRARIAEKLKAKPKFYRWTKYDN